MPRAGGQPDRIILKAADQLVQDAYLDDEVWEALREQFSVQQIMVLIDRGYSLPLGSDDD